MIPRVMKASKRANNKQRASQMARQDAEIAELKAQLATAIGRIEKLEQENARLRDDNKQLKEELAKAKKDS